MENDSLISKIRIPIGITGLVYLTSATANSIIEKSISQGIIDKRTLLATGITVAAIGSYYVLKKGLTALGDLIYDNFQLPIN